jgi:hypothetical protein
VLYQLSYCGDRHRDNPRGSDWQATRLWRGAWSRRRTGAPPTPPDQATGRRSSDRGLSGTASHAAAAVGPRTRQGLPTRRGDREAAAPARPQRPLDGSFAPARLDRESAEPDQPRIAPPCGGTPFRRCRGRLQTGGLGGEQQGERLAARDAAGLTGELACRDEATGDRRQAPAIARFSTSGQPFMRSHGSPVIHFMPGNPSINNTHGVKSSASGGSGPGEVCCSMTRRNADV